MKIRRLPSFFLSYVLIPKQQTEDKYHPPLLSLLWRPIIVQETFLLYYNLLKRTAEPTNNVITPYGSGHRCCLLHAHKTNYNTNIRSVPSKNDPVPVRRALLFLFVRPIRPATTLLCPSNDPAPRCAHVPPPPSIQYPRRRMSNHAAAETAWYALTVLSGSNRDCIFKIIHQKNVLRVGTNGRNTRPSNKRCI